MRAALPILILLLSACATTRSPSDHAGQGSRPLVPPASVGGEREANQIVHGAFGSREMTIDCILTVHGDKLTVIGLTALGVRAFTLHYDGRQVEVDNDLPVPAQLTPERLLADIQLVFWPASVLKPVLQKSGWQLTEPYSGTRRLKQGDKLIAEIHYGSSDPWKGKSWLVNLQYNYTLGIESNSLTAP